MRWFVSKFRKMLKNVQPSSLFKVKAYKEILQKPDALFSHMFTKSKRLNKCMFFE